jgi:DeoR family fructose operon transcriptional repressor
MLPSERQDRVLEILRKDKAVKVSELSDTFGVSEMTIRRDLLKLEQAGLVKRTFGGAVVAPNFFALQLSFAEKETVYAEEKKSIGLTAARLIKDGETIAFGGGTTTLQVARHIGEVEPLTVVTNAINIAMELANRPNIKLLVTGGSLIERSFALSGPFGEAMLGQIHINKFFLGATGVSIEHGVTTMRLLEASMYRAMMKAAGEVIVVTDHSKFGSVTLAPIAAIGEVTKIVTDTGIPADYLQELQESGVEVIVAELPGRGG